jgi:hypothetical protein
MFLETPSSLKIFVSYETLLGKRPVHVKIQIGWERINVLTDCYGLLIFNFICKHFLRVEHCP